MLTATWKSITLLAPEGKCPPHNNNGRWTPHHPDMYSNMSIHLSHVIDTPITGTKRRSAQMTILSVGAMGLGSLLLFLALLPAGQK